MTRNVIAWYVGDGVDRTFRQSQIYPLTIKTRLFSKRITVHLRSFINEEMVADTLHHFNNRKAFNKCWQIIKEDK